MDDAQLAEIARMVGLSHEPDDFQLSRALTVIASRRASQGTQLRSVPDLGPRRGMSIGDQVVAIMKERRGAR